MTANSSLFYSSLRLIQAGLNMIPLCINFLPYHFGLVGTNIQDWLLIKRDDKEEIMFYHLAESHMCRQFETQEAQTYK